ncbi:MAG TPA: replication-relaxation family protein [Bryobacteraceae bacterium]|nr:replication-relaxation family protein [Bryobacteraceae bacterium]
MKSQALFETTEYVRPQLLIAPAPTQAGFQLTESDIQMIEYVYRLRMATVDHLSVLTNRAYKKVHGRLYKLIEKRYLARIELPQQKHIYVIGREGIPRLVERGIAPKEALDWRLRHHELKELFLKHQLMVVDLHTILETATAPGPLRLAEWKEGRELWDSVTVVERNSRVALPVRPDAFFTIEDTRRDPGSNRKHFFLEADRSTTSHDRFQKKVRAYWAYLEQGLQTKKYGIRSFRVVTTTLTQARAANLSDAARVVLPQSARKYFLFTSVENLPLQKPEQIFQEIFLSPREGPQDGRYSLLLNS